MNVSGDGERLPSSIGGLLELALAAYLERVPLYAALGAVAFAISTIVQLARPDGIATAVAASIVGQALAIATVALGVGTRVADQAASSAKVFEAAIARWGDVAGATGIAWFLAITVEPASGLFGITDPTVLIAAPLVWLVLGALGMVGPVTALSGDRPVVAIGTGLWRAVAISIRVANLPRLAIVAVATLLPMVLEIVLNDVLRQHGAAHADFWATAPIDALAVGPITALQTVFALDFARRVGRLSR